MRTTLLLALILAFTSFVSGQELIINGDFTNPDDGKIYGTIDSIPGWKTDDHRQGSNLRDIFQGDGVCNQWDGAGSFYQVVGKVPAVETTFDVSFNLACTYSYWAGWKTPVYVIFSAYTGDDATTRVPIDSLEFEFWTATANYGKDSAINLQWVLPEASAFTGQHLVVEFKQFKSADYGYSESWTYLNYDDISVVATGGQVIVEEPEMGTELLVNGDFSLPADSVEHKNLNNIPGWKTDTDADNFNGRSNVNEGPRTKEAVAWLFDETPGIYQVVGTVPSSTTQYDISFDISCFYTWWGDYKSDFYVIFSAFDGTDATTRVPIDSLKFNYDCKSADWFKFATLKGTYILEAGNAHAGENLVIEFKPFNSADFGYGSSFTYFWLDNCSAKATTFSGDAENLVKNWDFSLPNDSIEHKNLNNIPNWKTDTTEEGFNGRSNVNEGPRKKEAVAWLWDETPGIYQTIGTVPSVATKFDVNFDLSCFYTWWGDYVSDFYVIFSSYAGDDATIRTPIDSIKFTFDCKSANWFQFSTLEGSYTLGAGHAKAGENLVVEFKPFNSADFGYGSSFTYFWLDNVVVKSNIVTHSIEKPEIDNLKIWSYNKKIYIDGADRINTVTVYDLMGRTVFMSKPYENVIDVPQLSGFHIVVVETDKMRKSQKVVF